MENMKNLKKDDFSDLTVNEVCLALVQSPICNWPYVSTNFLSLFVFKDSVLDFRQINALTEQRNQIPKTQSCFFFTKQASAQL